MVKGNWTIENGASRCTRKIEANIYIVPPQVGDLKNPEGFEKARCSSLRRQPEAGTYYPLILHSEREIPVTEVPFTPIVVVPIVVVLR